MVTPTVTLDNVLNVVVGLVVVLERVLDTVVVVTVTPDTLLNDVMVVVVVMDILLNAVVVIETVDGLLKTVVDVTAPWTTRTSVPPLPTVHCPVRPLLPENRKILYVAVPFPVLHTLTPVLTGPLDNLHSLREMGTVGPEGESGEYLS